MTRLELGVTWDKVQTQALSLTGRESLGCLFNLSELLLAHL